MARSKRKPHGRPQPGAPPASSVDLILTICRSAREHLTRPGCQAIDAELWASETLGLISAAIPMPHERAAAVASLIDEIGAVPRPGARHALLAFGAVGEAAFGAHARTAAARIAGSDPGWAADAGTGVPVSAWRSSDPHHDDGNTYAFEIRRRTGIHVLCVYVDNNIGGIPKDAFVLPSVAAFRTPFDSGKAPDLQLDELPVAEAAATVRAAVEYGRMFVGPPTSEDLRDLAALIEGHLRFLPPSVAPDAEPLDETTLAALAADFLAAPGNKAHRRGDNRDVLETILWFGNGYNVGGPLRWSPVVVEMFLADWVGRKVMADRRYIARIPVVLRDFVRYAGRARGVPDARVAETLDAIERWTPDLLAGGGTPTPFANAEAMARMLLDEYPGDAVDMLAANRADAAWALMLVAGPPPPADVLGAAAAAIRERYRAREELVLALRDLLPWQRLPRRDDRVVAGFAGAWASLAGAAQQEHGELDDIELLAELDPGDWHAIAFLVLDRKPVTADRIGRRLARATGDVALAEASVRRTFGGLLVTTWTSLGHLDERGVVTPLGCWAIPTGIAASWGYESQ